MPIFPKSSASFESDQPHAPRTPHSGSGHSGSGHVEFQRFGYVVFGIGLLIAATLVLLSLISHSPRDGSWNVAMTGTSYENWLGAWGAYVSDLLLQLLGNAAALIGCVIGVWGWHFMRFGSIRRGTRLFAQASIGILLCSAAFALSIPTDLETASADELVALHGLLAHAMLSLIGDGLWTLPILAIMGAAGLVLVLRSFALSRAQWMAVGGYMEQGLGTAFDMGGTASKSFGQGVARHLIRSPKIRNQLLPPKSETLKPKTRVARVTQEIKSFTIQALRSCGHLLATVLTGFNHLDDEPRHRQRDLPDLTKRSVGQNLGANSATAESEQANSGLFSRKTSRAASSAQASTGQQAQEAPIAGLQAFELPPLELLNSSHGKSPSVLTEDELVARGQELMETLADFGINGDLVGIKTGPVVSLFEFEPARGVKTQRVIRLADDIARSMRALSVRVAVVPGESVIGIELPNPTRETVFLRDVLNTPDFTAASLSLPIALGKTITGKPIIANLARMPHLLVAGTTGAGKSVGLNCMILSLLQKLPPEQCRMLMIDPKMLELSIYNGIPHLLTPVVTDAKKAVGALKWAVREMEDRYRALSQVGARNIDGYNERVCEARARGEALKRTVQTGFDAETGRPVYEEQSVDLIEFPHIVVIVDEMADLMMVAGKEIEATIQRLSQMARAAGIHLIMATQRPSVDVITGTIKANFPSRISFRVISKFDSRTILGEEGAEQLLGQGDMLFLSSGTALTRVHGPFVTEQEVEKVVNWLRSQSSPIFHEDLFESLDEAENTDEKGQADATQQLDELYDQAVALVTSEGRASTSFVQRKLQIGYNRAARLIEAMEQQGLIGAPDHVGRRKVLAGPPPPVDDYQ